MVWDSHLFKNFPQFVVIHRVKGFSMVSEAEVYIFLEFSCFFYHPMDVGNLMPIFALDLSKVKTIDEGPLLHLSPVSFPFPPLPKETNSGLSDLTYSSSHVFVLLLHIVVG